MDNSIDFIVSIYAIINIGAIFVPLPYNAPDERIKIILDDCEAKIVLTVTDQKIEFANNNILNICKLTYRKKMLVDGKTEIRNRDIARNKTDIIYICYTSGSTGTPKGVAIREESMINYVLETIKTFSYNEQTVNLNISPFYFDGSFGGVFCTFFCGGELVIFDNVNINPKKLIEKIKKFGITHIGSTPGLFSILVSCMNDKNVSEMNLKTIGLGGEVCPIEYICKLKKLLPSVRLFNRYGPTETTVIVSGYEITNADIYHKNTIPIGKPIANTEFYLVDEEDLLIEEKNSVGELYISGVQVMECYWNDTELTRNVLRTDIIKNKIMYKTGDLIYMDDSGNYVFVGRNDEMIKRNGYRIYLKEIENAFENLEGVKECICMYVKNKLIVWITTEYKAVSTDKLKEKLLKIIPAYMLPDKIVKLDKMPYTPIGKVDRKKILEMGE